MVGTETLLLNAVDVLVEQLKEKGYSGSFTTNAGYPGSLKESLIRFLEQTKIGNEPGFANGIRLTTYLHYTGEDRDYVVATFNARLSEDSVINVHALNIALGNQYQSRIKEVTLDLSVQEMPAKNAAIALVMPPRKQNKNLKGIRI